MNIFFAMLSKDFKLLINRSFVIIGILLIPVIFIGITIYNFSDLLFKKQFIEPFSIVLFDGDNSKYSNILTKQLEEISLFKDIKITYDKEEGLAYLNKDNDYVALIVIPENFVYQTSIGDNQPVTIIANKSTPFKAKIVENILNSATNLVTSGQSSINTIANFNNKLFLSTKELDQSFRESLLNTFFITVNRKEIFYSSNQQKANDISVPVSIFIASITLFIGFLGMPVIKILVTEKTNGISLRFKAANIKPFYSFLSKFLITLCFTYLQIFILFICAVFFFEIDIRFLSILNFVIVLTFSVFSFCSFSTFIAVLSTNHYAADITSNLSLFIMALLGGCFYPVYTLPQTFADIGNYTIHRQTINAFVNVVTNNSDNIFRYCSTLFLIGFILYFISYLISIKNSKKFSF